MENYPLKEKKKYMVLTEVITLNSINQRCLKKVGKALQGGHPPDAKGWSRTRAAI